ncbi:MAG: 50S ribosomal protein L15e, partial [Leptospiraceae bacterium]|nr:50S ribosomal protein L15e [Leptospiraceae bacterium]
VVARVRVIRGPMNVQRPSSGRRPKRMGIYGLTVNKSVRWIAEERANRKFPNMEVLGSYLVGEDGKFKWFEVILVDRSSPDIVADKNLNWITRQKGRVYRGLTPAGRKARGLRRKGRGAEKVRPSYRANFRNER